MGRAKKIEVSEVSKLLLTLASKEMAQAEISFKFCIAKACENDGAPKGYRPDGEHWVAPKEDS